MMGTDGNKVTYYHCADCGQTLNRLMDSNTTYEIDSALRREDVRKLKELKDKYKNIEWESKKTESINVLVNENSKEYIPINVEEMKNMLVSFFGTIDNKNYIDEDTLLEKLFGKEIFILRDEKCRLTKLLRDALEVLKEQGIVVVVKGVAKSYKYCTSDEEIKNNIDINKAEQGGMENVYRESREKFQLALKDVFKDEQTMTYNDVFIKLVEKYSKRKYSEDIKDLKYLAQRTILDCKANYYGINIEDNNIIYLKTAKEKNEQREKQHNQREKIEEERMKEGEKIAIAKAKSLFLGFLQNAREIMTQTEIETRCPALKQYGYSINREALKELCNDRLVEKCTICNGKKFAYKISTQGKNIPVHYDNLEKSFSKIYNGKDTFNISQTSNNSNNLSVADEIKKLKDLLDEGIITQEEFSKQKNKLLN